MTGGLGVILGRVLLDAAYVYEHGGYVDLQANAVRGSSRTASRLVHLPPLRRGRGARGARPR